MNFRHLWEHISYGRKCQHGEGASNNKSQGNPTLIISSSFDTSGVNTTISLTPFYIPISTILPPSIQSPTFDNILQQPITSLFPSQSTEGPKTVHDNDTTEDGEFKGTFVDIEFDLEEENIPDHMLMFGKQFKILNRKLNSLLQLQTYAGGRHSISGIEVDVMLKAQELRLRKELELMDRNNENRVKAQSSSFNLELKELKFVEKEKHILYIQYVKKVREDVNLKLEELRVDMEKEVAAISHDYSTLHIKVDIIADVVMNVVKWYQSLLPKVEKKAEIDAQSFGKVEELLNNIKDLVSKTGSSSSSVITPEYFS